MNPNLKSKFESIFKEYKRLIGKDLLRTFIVKREGSIIEDLKTADIVNNLSIINEILLNLINRTKLDKNSRILPILVSSEIEKTQFYDLLKDKEEDCKIIYIPNPPRDVDSHLLSF